MRALALMALVLALLLGRPALAREMMLEDEPSREFSDYGWTFLVLAGSSLLYGINSYNSSRDSLDEAKANYQLYLGAGTSDAVTAYRAATNDSLNDARTEETRANIALYLTILFGVTSYYSFNPEDLPDNTLFVGHNSIIFRTTF